MQQRCTVWCLFVALTATSAWGATFQSVDLYPTVHEVAVWANDLGAANPDLVNVVQYGTSYQGRPLLAIEITANPGVNDLGKPEFLFAAGIHAREVITTDAACKLADYLVNGYRDGDEAIQNILSTREVWIIPNQNPDGRMVVEGGYSEHRKNMHWYAGQNTSDYTRGVDLNRNYPHQWSLASANVLDETYRGPSALSEPESQSLWTLLHDESKFNDLRCALDIHSGAATILTPWISQTEFDADPLPAADRQKFDFLAGRMGELTGFSTQRLGYDSWGTLTDSLYEEFGAYAITEEIFIGPFEDYFTFFNPVDAATRDLAVQRLIASSTFLLSDEAFLVPEPSSLAMLVSCALVTLVGIGRLRRRRPSCLGN